jgi:3-isopropylmalate/(R)-2-methylmalate dehydratase large subunit
MGAPRTLFEKVWTEHVVVEETADTPAVLYIDLHLIHEVTTPQAFALLRSKGLPVRRPDLTLATMDHSTPTTPVSTFKDLLVAGEGAAAQIRQMENNCAEFGVELHGFDSVHRGIVHVIGPELGATQPGKTIVCGDSHTSTHGAFGALAFGIGTTEVGHVLATQCLLQRRPKTLGIDVSGGFAPGVGAKDLILSIIGQIGVGGGTGHVIEYHGEAISSMGMEARMTVCNMSIEAGARAGMIAPDEATFEYLQGRVHSPTGGDGARLQATLTRHSIDPFRSRRARSNPWSLSARTRAWSSASMRRFRMVVATPVSARRLTTCSLNPVNR